MAPGSPAPAEESFTAADDFDPRYCTMCHARIPVALSEKQGVCNECLRAMQIAGLTPKGVPPEAMKGLGIDTHMGVCPKCGSRNLVDDSYNHPFEGLVSGILDLLEENPYSGTFWMGGNSGSNMNVRLRCRDCGHEWRP